MSIISDNSKNKKNPGNALLLGVMARKAKALDPTVIDSTIGMLYDEEGKFFTFNTVEKATSALSNTEKYAYPSTCGSNEFHEAVYKWVFRQYYDEFKENCYLDCIATPGGTGALCLSFENYLEKGQKVLLPSYMWANYTQLAEEAGLGYETFDLFNDEGTFNLEAFREKCIELKKSQGRVCVVINDPCENPTGYSMSYTDWIGVVQIINDITRDSTPFILIYDMAYIDYDKRGFDVSRNNIRLFEKLNKSVLTIMCFSGSKTLGLYGLRVGAQICVAQSEEDKIEFHEANDFSARGKWSGVSLLGQNIITKVLTDYYDEFSSEIDYARKLLITRANTFISEAEKVGLKHVPFDCGFFVTIPCDDPKGKAEELKQKGLYILPIKNAIRLTISSISEAEVVRAVHILKETL